MAHPTIYPAVGLCIYCQGPPEIPPTVEHIIPESLGGALILPDCCCKKCRETINKYEWTVGRRIFGDFRIRHNFKSKRPKKNRPKTITLDFVKEGNITRKEICRSEWPGPVFLYFFEKCAFARGAGKESEFLWEPRAYTHFPHEMDELIAKYGEVIFPVSFHPNEFARMLAKIAYSFVVSQLGMGNFLVYNELLDVILNRTDNVGWLVGAEMSSRPLENKDHYLRLGYTHEHNKILVQIRLFPMLPTPLYHVFVGEFDLNKANHIVTLAQKFKDGVLEDPFV